MRLQAIFDNTDNLGSLYGFYNLIFSSSPFHSWKLQHEKIFRGFFGQFKRKFKTRLILLHRLKIRKILITLTLFLPRNEPLLKIYGFNRFNFIYSWTCRVFSRVPLNIKINYSITDPKKWIRRKKWEEDKNAECLRHLSLSKLRYSKILPSFWTTKTSFKTLFLN